METYSLNLMESIPGLPLTLNLKFYTRFLRYRPQFEIYTETSNYILKTATQIKELSSVFQLRYKIFLEHKHHGERIGHDLDKFDNRCDHLIIIDKSSGQIVGTYRVLSSLFTDRYYSETEFNLGNFLAKPGIKLELGRACIDARFRNGAVIDLLWRGIAEYIKITGANYLFGCSSLKTIDPAVAQSVLNYFQEEGILYSDYGIRPLPEFDHLHDNLKGSITREEVKKMIPPLLRSYLSAGSQVHGTPAFDLDFKCIDFLTILDINKLSGIYANRYFRQ